MLRVQQDSRQGCLQRKNWTSVFEISVTLGDNSFTRQIVSTDINTLNKTGPLIDELYRLAGELQEHPVTAIRINVNYSPENSNFVVSIVNSGERAALINDPQALPRDEDNYWTTSAQTSFFCVLWNIENAIFHFTHLNKSIYICALLFKMVVMKNLYFLY